MKPLSRTPNAQDEPELKGSQKRASMHTWMRTWVSASGLAGLRVAQEPTVALAEWTTFPQTEQEEMEAWPPEPKAPEMAEEKLWLHGAEWGTGVLTRASSRTGFAELLPLASTATEEPEEQCLEPLAIQWTTLEAPLTRFPVMRSI